MRLRQSLRPWLMIVFSMALGCFQPVSLRADTLRIVTLGSDQDRFLYGISDTGSVVIDTSAYCKDTCYSTYTSGSYAATTSTVPNLNFDNGTACLPSIAGYVVERGVCNAGSVAWTGYPEGKPVKTAVFFGTDPNTDLVAAGGEGFLMLNSAGNLVWDDHFSEEFYVALPSAVTPEPASFCLLLTGLLGGTAVFVRRRRHQATTVQLR